MTLAALGLFTAVTWPGVPFALAALTAEQLPPLLSDIEWKKPDSDADFRARFHPGVPEAELLAWLERSRFSIDRDDRKAVRRIEGFPCAQRAEIHWAVGGSVLLDARATVAEGCL